MRCIGGQNWVDDGQAAHRTGQVPYCHSSVLQGWGRVVKPVRDPQLQQVQAHRFRCGDCRRTCRHCPQGICRADQVPSLQQLAAIAWVFGRDGQALAVTLRRPPDGFYTRLRGVNIGRWRVRFRSVRGFKSWTGLFNACELCAQQFVLGRIRPPLMCPCAKVNEIDTVAAFE